MNSDTTTPVLERFPVQGTTAPGFEAVRDCFTLNFINHGEVGAAFCVTREGECVVDLWGGAADPAVQHPWEADTLVNVWSSTKGALALAMHILADHGLLDFDAPVARYWPKFSQQGKEGVKIRHILSHTAGLPAPSLPVPDEAVYDWHAMVRALERSELFWEPGTKCGYHAATFGWLNGEVLHRITGMLPGEFIRAEICAPLQSDILVGLTPAEQARCAETIPPAPVAAPVTADRMIQLVSSNPPRKAEEVNTARWRAAQIPSSNGHASARGLARLYTPLALGGGWRGQRILSAQAVERAREEQVRAVDLVGGTLVRRTLGYMLPDPALGDARAEASFGHGGRGGSNGLADPRHRLAMGYVMNRMLEGVEDPRFADLCRSVYDCLESQAA